ncbi:MAG: HisA/HisF-related TIM barrel protein, partial [Chromatiales bacterium]|nr:HisA/HisF-related TIM barrel protein [Chromatiales bacterium]
ECRQRFPAFLFQASGGVRRLDDLHELEATGVAGAISGRALLEGDLRLEEARTFLPNA